METKRVYLTLPLRSKQDSIITGRGHNIVRGVEEFAITESAYADDADFLFPSREIAECYTPGIMKHCAEWGMEVHSGTTKTPDAKGKTSKTELLFVEKTSHTELTNLSPIILEDGRFIPAVNKICYLVSFINHDLRESEDIDNRMNVKQGDVLGPIIFIIYMVALTNT